MVYRNEEVCLSCAVTHGPGCAHCNKDKCLECKSGWSLVNGTCYDCSFYPNSAECDKEGPTKCKNSYFLETNNGIRNCTMCSEYLDNCLECTSSSVCTKCTTLDLFSIQDGKCSCKAGVNSIYSEANDTCVCSPGYLLVEEGCRDCSSIFSDCRKCEKSASLVS